ncbi:MAG: MMPL family transporter [Sphingomonadales bacterium]|nr:MMPL family transporter [Sphingomonadales bacterium]
MFARHLLACLLAAARRPFATLLVAALAVAAALACIALRFDITTDTGALISAETPWRKAEARIETAFPQLKDSLTVVIDGATPELAEDAAARLSAAMAADPRHFLLVERPDGGDFFAREGLLFAPVAEVKATVQQLIDAQSLLGPLAADPTLAGIARAITTAADGAASGTDPAQAARLTAPLAGLSRSIDRRLDGQKAWFSWQRLFSKTSGSLAPPTRRIILARVRLDYGDLEPGSAATAALRGAAAALALDPAHGVTLGITGEVPLADEEFASIRDNIGLVGLLMAAAMTAVLWFATRSLRMVAAIMLTILAGLALATAVGLLAEGRLNLISLAFIPLFVGLGVDFGIQICVRVNAERREGATMPAALERSAQAIGEPLLLAAAAIVLALGAFLPTQYVGVAELGVIAGLGMMIAFLLNITLLPALLVLLRPGVPRAAVGWAGAAPVDRWLARHRRAVLASFALAMAVSIAGLGWVRFDFNPLHLRDPHSPAMRTLSRLMRDPERTPNTIAILAPSLDAADRLAARLEKRPEIAEARTLSSFVPPDQAPKLALIDDASLLLDATVNPFALAPPGDDATTRASLATASASLGKLAAARSGPLAAAAKALASSFARLAAAPAAQRAPIAAMLTEPLQVTLANIRASLQASAVDRAGLPATLRADWVSPSGAALVEVTPAGDSLDNRVLARFATAVRAIAPDATGLPVATQEAAATVSRAFIEAGVLALLLVSTLLYAVLRSAREVAFTLAPVVLSGFLTLGSCVVIGQPLNFANIIAFPLLFGVGVAFHIYFVMAWRAGTRNLLQTSLARAVVSSALATGSAFGALWFSHHPGTASMGLILMISLIWTLVCALIFEPALLGPAPGAR